MSDENVTPLFPTDEELAERDDPELYEEAEEAAPATQAIFVKPEPTILVVIRNNVDPLSLGEAKELATGLVAAIAEAEAVDG